MTLPETAPPEPRIVLGPDAHYLHKLDERFAAAANQDLSEYSEPVQAALGNEEQLAKDKADEIEFFTNIREQMFREIPYYEEQQIVEHFGVTEDELSALIDASMLLALSDHGDRLYPQFQFDPNTEAPYPIMFNVNMFLDSAHDPWGSVGWWTQANGRLPDQVAPQALLSDPARHEELLQFAATIGVHDDL